MLFLILSGLFVIGCFASMVIMTIIVNNRRKKKTRQLIEYYGRQAQNRRRAIGEIESSLDSQAEGEE